MSPTGTDTCEPLLCEEARRLNIFPIQHPDLWAYYKRALSAFWPTGDVDLSKDPSDWKKLSDAERHFFSHVLAFFACADGIVSDNLAARFGQEVKVREAIFFYDLQKSVENIHNEMYSLLIDTLITEPAERDRLFHAVEKVPCVRKKAEWATRWIDSSDSFATRLVAFAVVEGVFFSASFCSIYWLKSRGNLMPGLCASNILIARDEGMHQEFACHLYRTMVQEKLPEETVHEIVREAVAHEEEFCVEALPVSLIGMNAADMVQYVRYVADNLLGMLGVEKLYHVECPFDFMSTLGLQEKTNFFEHRSTEYQLSGATAKAESHVFDLETDF